MSDQQQRTEATTDPPLERPEPSSGGGWGFSWMMSKLADSLAGAEEDQPPTPSPASSASATTTTTTTGTTPTSSGCKSPSLVEVIDLGEKIEGTIRRSHSATDDMCYSESSSPETFNVRGQTYLSDKKKIPALGSVLCDTVALDLLQHSTKIDDICSLRGSVPRRLPRQFFFVVNYQIPVSPPQHLVHYMSLKHNAEEIDPVATRLFRKFVDPQTTAEWRNARFKLIPSVVEGPWIAKKAVGTGSGTPALLGNKLTTTYFRGANYLEACVDVGSSMPARSIFGVVKSCLKMLVIDLAILIQGNSVEELPERILTVLRVNHISLDARVTRILPESIGV